MLKSLFQDSRARQLTIIYIFFLIFWLEIRPFDPTSTIYEIFSATYGILAFFGAIWGLSISRKWGGTKSIMGRAIIFFALGLFAQEFGQIIYSFYSYFLKIEIPYPSWGDLGYFGSIPLYILGVLNLATASGVNLEYDKVKKNAISLLIHLSLLFVAYVLFLKGYAFDWSQPLRVFLDFGYPFGQAIYVSLTLTTYLFSRKLLGGLMKPKILMILFALFIQFVSDYSYLFQAQQQTAYPGSYNDLLYLTAYFLMTISLLNLEIKHTDIKKHSKQ